MNASKPDPVLLPKPGPKGRRRLPLSVRDREKKAPGAGGTATLTQEVHAAIISCMLESGVHAAVAARACGVPDTTFRDWIAKGLDPECTSRYAPRYRALVAAVENAEAVVEAKQAKRIVDAGEQTWQAAAWYLERKHKDRWARADQLDVTSRGQGLFDVLLRVDADRRGEMIEGEVIGELPDAVSSQDTQEGG